MVLNKGLLTFLIILMFLLVIGCSDNADFGPDNEMSGEVRVMWDMDSGLSQDVFVIDHLKQQFPGVDYQLTKMQRQYHHYSSFNIEPN